MASRITCRFQICISKVRSFTLVIEKAFIKQCCWVSNIAFARSSWYNSRKLAVCYYIRFRRNELWLWNFNWRKSSLGKMHRKILFRSLSDGLDNISFPFFHLQYQDIHSSSRKTHSNFHVHSLEQEIYNVI